MHTDLRDLRLSRKDFRTLQHHMRQPRPCLLCGAFPTACNVIFRPDKPELWGGQPGKARLMGYALCKRCYALPDVIRHVEGKLMRNLVGRGN
jgi:hypothetical protein